MKMLRLRKINFRKNSLLLRFFLCLSMIAALSLILLTITMYYWFRIKATDDFNKVSKIVLLNTEVAFSNYVNYAQNYAIGLFQNPNVKKSIIDDSIKTDYGWNNTVVQIQNILSANTYINSVYLMNNSGVILKISEKKYADFDSQKELFNAVSTRNMIEGPMFWTMKSKYSGEPDIKTLTVFYHEGVMQKGNFGGAVSVNIDLDELEKKIFSDQIKADQKFYIVDNKGKMLINNGMKEFGENVSS